jgi:hypothetical protein
LWDIGVKFCEINSFVRWPIFSVSAKLLTDAQIRALPPIPKGGKRAVMSCGDGLMVVNDPVVGSKPCIRFVHRYFQKVQGREKTKQNELSLGSYGKGGGKISLA